MGICRRLVQSAIVSQLSFPTANVLLLIPYSVCRTLTVWWYWRVVLGVRGFVPCRRLGKFSSQQIEASVRERLCGMFRLGIISATT